MRKTSASSRSWSPSITPAQSIACRSRLSSCRGGSVMADWNTRLEVKLGDRTVTPISNFTPTFNVLHTVIHSLEQDGTGYVRQPFTFTFTMTVPAIAGTVADLTELAVDGTEFSISVAEK